MASKEQIDERLSILRKRGVPEAFADRIATRRDNAWAWVSAFLIYSGLLAAGTAAYLKWPSIIDLVLSWPYHDQARGSVLFVPQVTYHLFGYGLIFLLTWTPIALASILRPNVKPWPAYDATASNLRMLDTENESLDKVKVSFTPAELVGIGSEEAFLLHVKGRNKRLQLKIFIWMLVVVLAAWFPSRFDYWKLMPDYIEAHRYGQVERFPLSKVRYVEIECKTGTGDDADTHAYKLVFPERTFNIAVGNDIVNGLGMNDITRRVLQVDQALRGGGLEIHHFPSDAACISKWAEGLDPIDQAQLKAMFSKP